MIVSVPTSPQNYNNLLESYNSHRREQIAKRDEQYCKITSGFTEFPEQNLIDQN